MGLTTSWSLQVEEVTKSYGRSEVLHGISARFDRGVTAVLGRNGAGKSTLVRILVDAESPSSGRRDVRCDTGVVTRSQAHAEVGWLPQTFGYPPSMSVGAYLCYAAWLKGLGRRDAREAALAASEFSDVTAVLRRRLGQLSGGTLRRVGLGAAIVHSPHVLVLDEPTAGLDPIQRSRFHGHIRELGTSATVVLATHLLEDVAAVADSLLVLDQGRVIWSGSRESALAEAGHRSDDVVALLRHFMMELLGSEFE